MRLKRVLQANEDTFWHEPQVTKFVLARMSVYVKSDRKPTNALAQHVRKCIDAVDICDLGWDWLPTRIRPFRGAATGNWTKASNLLKSWQPQPD